MGRFIKDSDYDGRIKKEIKQLISGAIDEQPTQALLLAEETAIATIKEYIGSRYDCDLIFEPATETADERNKHIVKIVIALTLFDLYSQTPAKDLPEHRKVAYDDAISWLKDVGRGTINSGVLPILSEQQKTGEIRANSRTPINHKW